MLLYMLKECHISIMRAQLLINMIITWVSKICELVPYTDINPLLRRQLILLNVLIYDSQAVWCLGYAVTLRTRARLRLGSGRESKQRLNRTILSAL